MASGLYPIEQDPLRDFLPRWVLENTRVEFGVPERVCIECTSAMAPDALIKVGSNPGPDVIVLHPTYYRRGTASGEALRAHELFHIWQRSVVADFEGAFSAEARRIEALGLMPWENGFERPAYAFERAIRQRLLERGYPLSNQSEEAAFWQVFASAL